MIAQKKLDKAMEYWKHILRLDDVTLEISFKRLDKFDSPVYGESECHPVANACLIHILDPRDYEAFSVKTEAPVISGRKAITRDIENTIVHELVHIRLAKAGLKDLYAGNPRCKTGVCEFIEEDTVVRLTSAILDESRRQLR